MRMERAFYGALWQSFISDNITVIFSKVFRSFLAIRFHFELVIP